MKEHAQEYGIRRWAGDDLVELQSEPLEAIQKLVEPYAPCILQGCEVKAEEKRITPGLVALWELDENNQKKGVKIARFEGCVTGSFPVYLTLKCTPEKRVYVEGGSKPIAYDYTAQNTTVENDVKDKFPLEIKETGGPRLVDTLGITQKLDREEAQKGIVSFTKDTAEKHTNIQSGSTLGSLFGKIERWFDDLKSHAFRAIAKEDLAETLKNELDGKASSSHTHTLVSLGAAASNHTHNYLPLSGGTMTGPVVFGTVSNNNKPNNYISAGGGYGVNSGKYGLKLLDFDAPDGQSGIGQDLTGYTYEMTIANAQSSTGESHITFAKHAAGSTTYTRLAEIDGSGNFNTQGQLKENGTRVYSPNNMPTPSALGAASSSHTHSVATTSANGMMSSTDKQKLEGLSNYTLPTASSSVLGGIKTNYTTSGKNYKVSVDGSGNAYVNVPWSDTNTTYSVATTTSDGLMPSADKTFLDKIIVARISATGSGFSKKRGEFVAVRTATGTYKISYGNIISTSAVLVSVSNQSKKLFADYFITSGAVMVYIYDQSGTLTDSEFSICVYL